LTGQVPPGGQVCMPDHRSAIVEIGMAAHCDRPIEPLGRTDFSGVLRSLQTLRAAPPLRLL
jgi:hypothetical protein